MIRSRIPASPDPEVELSTFAFFVVMSADLVYAYRWYIVIAIFIGCALAAKGVGNKW